MAEPLGNNSYLIDTGLYRPQHAGCYLIHDAGEFAFVDTGTQHTLPDVLGALASCGGAPEQVRYVIPTHVHLDHAGGAGQLMQACPNATLIVHPKGEPHMVDPAKLQAGATAVYGEAAFARDFGTLLPIDAARTRAAEDALTLPLGGRRMHFIHTPGHANHHGCVFDEASGYLYTGDTFGLGYRELRRDGAPLLVATTTPVAFDPDAWFDSLDRMLALDPAACCLTHFGKVDAPAKWADMLRASIVRHRDIALAEEAREPDGRDARLLQAVETELVSAGVTHSGLPADRVREIFASDITLNSQGLAIWLKRRARHAA